MLSIFNFSLDQELLAFARNVQILYCCITLLLKVALKHQKKKKKNHVSHV
jgi:hypothetical protein